MELSGKTHKELLRRLHVIKDTNFIQELKRLLSYGIVFQDIDGYLK